jgi:hypothetical protein
MVDMRATERVESDHKFSSEPVDTLMYTCMSDQRHRLSTECMFEKMHAYNEVFAGVVQKGVQGAAGGATRPSGEGSVKRGP